MIQIQLVNSVRRLSLQTKLADSVRRLSSQTKLANSACKKKLCTAAVLL